MWVKNKLLTKIDISFINMWKMKFKTKKEEKSNNVKKRKKIWLINVKKEEKMKYKTRKNDFRQTKINKL